MLDELQLLRAINRAQVRNAQYTNPMDPIPFQPRNKTAAALQALSAIGAQLEAGSVQITDFRILYDADLNCNVYCFGVAPTPEAEPAKTA